jgi:hypothetical protein
MKATRSTHQVAKILVFVKIHTNAIDRAFQSRYLLCDWNEFIRLPLIRRE